MRKYILFNKYDEEGNATQQDPYSIVSITAKKAADDSIIESGLSAVKDTSYYANGHYYVNLSDTGYTGGTIYYLEVTVQYISGAPSKVLKKYFSPRAPIDTTDLDAGFKERLGIDAKTVFLNINEFAEYIIYNGKTIKAIIMRERTEPAEQGQGRLAHNQVEFFISNDSDEGIDTVDKNNDIVFYPQFEGGSNVQASIVEILGLQGSMWHLLIEI